MTIQLIDGFDAYNGTQTNIGLQSKWTCPSVLGMSCVTGRFGGQALRLASGAAINAQRTWAASPSATLALGNALQVNTLPTGAQVLCHLLLLSGSSGQMGIGVNTSGGLSVYRAASYNSATLLGSTANGIIVSGTWYYLECEAVISTTVGTINLYLNGASVLSLTGLNNSNVGSGGVDSIQYNLQNGSTGLGNINWDDLYMVDVASRIGERRIETLRAASDSSAVWTPNSGANNFSRVNETLVDGDTSYVSSSTVGDRDLYTIAPLSTTPAGIDAVQVSLFGEKTDALTRTIYNSIQSAGTNSDGSAFNLAASYGKFERIIANDPHTGAPWTASGVNNLLIGPKVAA